MIDIYDGVVSLEERYLLPDEPGLYFIVQDEKVIYVGQSTKIRTRLMTHHRFSQFAQYNSPKIYWLITPVEKLLQIERVFIEKLSPELNGTKVPALQNSKSVPKRKREYLSVTLYEGQGDALDNLALTIDCINSYVYSPNGPLPNKSRLFQLIAANADDPQLIKLLREMMTKSKLPRYTKYGKKAIHRTYNRSQ